VRDILFIGSVVLVALVTVGCPNSSSPTPTPAPTPAPTLTPEQTLAIACIVGKTINVTGTYYTNTFAGPINIDRQADISADLFKVREEGGDELAEVESEAEVAKWRGDQFEISSVGIEGEGVNEVECFKVSYSRGPFPGPSGNCKIVITAIVCEDCEITEAAWILTCDLEADGTGGSTKASGAWSVAQ